MSNSEKGEKNRKKMSVRNLNYIRTNHANTEIGKGWMRSRNKPAWVSDELRCLVMCARLTGLKTSQCNYEQLHECNTGCVVWCVRALCKRDVLCACYAVVCCADECVYASQTAMHVAGISMRMRAFVWVCVCVHMCVHVCVYLGACACVHVCTSVCIFTSLHACMCMHACECVHMHQTEVQVCMCITWEEERVCECTSVCTCVCTCVQAYLDACLDTHMKVRQCVCMPAECVWK